VHLTAVTTWYSRHLLNCSRCSRYGLLPMAARSKARTVFSRWNTGIAGSNSARGMHVCPCFSVLCCPVCRQRLCVELIPRRRSPAKCPTRLINFRSWIAYTLDDDDDDDDDDDEEFPVMLWKTTINFSLHKPNIMRQSWKFRVGWGSFEMIAKPPPPKKKPHTVSTFNYAHFQDILQTYMKLLTIH
jgi:hypothetical protein